MSIIIISPRFYNYHYEIKKELQSKQSKVILVNEIPFISVGIYSKVLCHFKAIVSFIWNLYLLRLKRAIKKYAINTVFIIRGYYIPETILIQLKATFPSLRILYYQWDSIQNNPNSLIIAKYAEKSFTFDLNDSILYQDIFTYLPLFFHWPPNSEKLRPYKSDVLMLSSWSEYRSQVLENIKLQLTDLNIKWEIYFYLPPIVFLKHVFTGKYNRVKDVHIRTINKAHYLSLLKGCKAVLDIPSPRQSGASIRVIEALSMGKKVITTNKDLPAVLNNKGGNNILYYSNFALYNEFLQSPFIVEDNMSDVVLSLQEWLNQIGI